MQVKDRALRIAKRIARAPKGSFFEPIARFRPGTMLPIEIGAEMFVEIDTVRQEWVLVARETPYPDCTTLVVFWHADGKTEYIGGVPCK